MPKGSSSALFKRPVLKIPYSLIERLFEMIGLIGILAILGVVLMSWPELPARIPSHFNAAGIPDGWSGKGSVWLLPGAAVGFYIVLSILSRFPHAFNYLWTITENNAERQYSIARTMVRALKAELIWLFTYIEYTTIQVAMGKTNSLGIIFLPVSLVVIFGTVVIFLVKGYKAK